jgi:glyoxylase-like metal-dependent hydrolase (beta-lactamase superfamily II)
LHLGDVTYPDASPLAGHVAPIFAFVIRHPDGVVLVDTGIGTGEPVIEQLYHPRLRPLSDALAEAGVRVTDVSLVVNSHLHFDHCGGNRLFPGVPIYVQQDEYEAAQERFYTVPGWVEFPGCRYELLTGERELLPGVKAVPTPGHTPGHQSVDVATPDGRVIIAGQAAMDVGEFEQPEPGHPGGMQMAWNRDRYLASLRALHGLRPRAVHLSHDAAVWRPHGPA